MAIRNWFLFLIGILELAAAVVFGLDGRAALCVATVASGIGAFAMSTLG